MKEIDDYLANVDEKRQAAFRKLYETVKDNLPVGFEKNFQYNINREDEPVPFISLAAQKNHIALYHMGIMGDKNLLTWFEEEYQKQVPTKLNMGKSCIRMTNVKNIPYELLGELVSKMTLEEWLQSYEKYTNK
jgi:hypothetical protein